MLEWNQGETLSTSPVSCVTPGYGVGLSRFEACDTTPDVGLCPRVPEMGVQASDFGLVYLYWLGR